MDGRGWWGVRLLRRLNADVLTRRGYRHLDSSDPARAAALFREALDSVPARATTPYTVSGLALAQMELRQWAEAAETYSVVMTSWNATLRTQAMVNLGICKSRSGDLPGAMALWSRVAEGAPPIPATFAHLCLGEELLRMGEIQASRPHLETAMTSPQAETVACAQANLGHVHALNDDRAEADDCWTFARRSGFASAGTQADFFRATQLVRDGDVRAGVKLLRTVVAADHPDSSEDAQQELRRIEGMG